MKRERKKEEKKETTTKLRWSEQIFSFSSKIERK